MKCQFLWSAVTIDSVHCMLMCLWQFVDGLVTNLFQQIDEKNAGLKQFTSELSGLVQLISDVDAAKNKIGKIFIIFLKYCHRYFACFGFYDWLQSFPLSCNFRWFFVRILSIESRSSMIEWMSLALCCSSICSFSWSSRSFQGIRVTAHKLWRCPWWVRSDEIKRKTWGGIWKIPPEQKEWTGTSERLPHVYLELLRISYLKCFHGEWQCLWWLFIRNLL